MIIFNRGLSCFGDYYRLDDPVMLGFKGFPIADPKLARWVLAAEDICSKNSVLSCLVRLGIQSLYFWPFSCICVLPKLVIHNSKLLN